MKTKKVIHHLAAKYHVVETCMWANPEGTFVLEPTLCQEESSRLDKHHGGQCLSPPSGNTLKQRDKYRAQNASEISMHFISHSNCPSHIDDTFINYCTVHRCIPWHN